MADKLLTGREFVESLGGAFGDGYADSFVMTNQFGARRVTRAEWVAESRRWMEGKLGPYSPPEAKAQALGEGAPRTAADPWASWLGMSSADKKAAWNSYVASNGTDAKTWFSRRSAGGAK